MKDSLFTPNLTIRSVKSVDTVKPSKETTKLPPVDGNLCKIFFTKFRKLFVFVCFFVADLFFDSAVKMSDTVKSSKEQKASIDSNTVFYKI